MTTSASRGRRFEFTQLDPGAVAHHEPIVVLLEADGPWFLDAVVLVQKDPVQLAIRRKLVHIVRDKTGDVYISFVVQRDTHRTLHQRVGEDENFDSITPETLKGRQRVIIIARIYAFCGLNKVQLAK